MSPEVMQEQVCTIYNMSDHVVSDRQTQAEGESCVSDTTQTQWCHCLVKHSNLWIYWQSNLENRSYVK